MDDPALVGVLQGLAELLAEVRRVGSEGVIRNLTKGAEYGCEAFPEFMNELMRMGGLVPWVRQRLEERRTP